MAFGTMEQLCAGSFNCIVTTVNVAGTLARRVQTVSTAPLLTQALRRLPDSADGGPQNFPRAVHTELGTVRHRSARFKICTRVRVAGMQYACDAAM